MALFTLNLAEEVESFRSTFFPVDLAPVLLPVDGIPSPLLLFKCLSSDSVLSRLSFLACSFTDLMLVEWSTTTVWSSLLDDNDSSLVPELAPLVDLPLAWSPPEAMGDSTRVELFMDELSNTTVLSSTPNELLRLEFGYCIMRNFSFRGSRIQLIVFLLSLIINICALINTSE